MTVHWHDDECAWCPCDEPRSADAPTRTFQALASRALVTKNPADIAAALFAYEDSEKRAPCATCGQSIHYLDAPSGAWWAHDAHPADEHEAVPA